VPAPLRMLTIRLGSAAWRCTNGFCRRALSRKWCLVRTADAPYHCDVFVLTHHLKGGTIFHFVADGIEPALQRAREAAGGKDIRLGGGVATIRQYLRAGLIDELHIAIAPTILGSGENLFAGIDLVGLGYKVAEHVATEKATHIVLRKA
jgi:dihydrofolate reductase